MRARTTLAVGLALALVACDDEGGGGGTVVLGDSGPGRGIGADADILAVEDARVARPDTGAPSDGGPGPTPDGGPGVDAAPMGECAPGMVRCVEEGQQFRQVCRDDRRWAVERCSADELCAEGLCVGDPGDCAPGERTCLSPDVPGVCGADGWQRQTPCTEGEICQEGVCRGLACAEAAANRSYLGCDYIAVDLPNAAFTPGDESTPTAPIGVVVANPDFVETATVRVDGPNGMPAQLVGERRINVPPSPQIQANYQAQTVRSEVRDGDGMVVETGIVMADGVEIPPGGIATLLLPNGGAPPTNSGVAQRAYRIRTDRPVAAYQFSPYCCNYSFSNDASLLFPVTALGTDYRFLGVPHWGGNLGVSNFPGAMVVVGTEDGTQVDVALPRNGDIAADPAGRVRNAAGRVSLQLNAQEVMVLNTVGRGLGDFSSPPRDLSGARVTTDKPVAVFSAHHCTNYPELLTACDHLQEQLFPTGTWGNNFVLVPPPERGNNSAFEQIYWKIIARDAGTRVTLSATWDEIQARGTGFSGVPDCATMLAGDRRTIVLQGEGFCEFSTKRPVQIEADGTLMVMGILSGQESTGAAVPFGAHAGDPAIFLVPPDAQYRNDYAFLVPDTYFNDFVTVTLDADTSLMLDGVEVPLGDAQPIPGSTRVFKHVSVSDGPHRLQANRPFGILVVAYDDFVSYAFTGGLNLRKR
ncbi:MAG: IgGFc-binding protein [Myxococcales bacterium]|nr:IgGFc-binding protein [Myxococcales bacterium]